MDHQTTTDNHNVIQLTERKRKRMESKKRKAEAFLALVGHTKELDSNSFVSDLNRSQDNSLLSTTYSPETKEETGSYSVVVSYY